MSVKKSTPNGSFKQCLTAWSTGAVQNTGIPWAEQLSILTEVEDLITPELTLEEITESIYQNVNQLLDAFQFAVGLYDEKKANITYKGMIENGERIPDFSMDAMDNNRLASWCIRNEKEIFMNDFDKEYSLYLQHKPVPLAGSNPKAAIYVPLKLSNKVVGLIMVRTIHKNVYQPHHLFLLKTVGNFVVRTLALTKISSRLSVSYASNQKVWNWNNIENLAHSSKKIFSSLTSREKDVLLLLVSGMPNKDIANMLFVSPGTIKTHTLNIYRKMNVPNRSTAILKSLDWEWII
ncbi:MAG: LuxR C-terminal-related transcriptional regulator [Ferruginibacter sp.]